MLQELYKIKGKRPDSKCWKFCDVFMQITYDMKDKIFHRINIKDLLKTQEYTGRFIM